VGGKLPRSSHRPTAGRAFPVPISTAAPGALSEQALAASGRTPPGMRARGFPDKFVPVDEAQKPTPKPMKTPITRAGPGTRVACLGNLAQIDTRYLAEVSSGLPWAVDRFKSWPHGARAMHA
jgi:phosphate starvation-inducible protein PhoH